MDNLTLIQKYESYFHASEKYFQLQEKYEELNKRYEMLCQEEKKIRDKTPAIAWIFLIFSTAMGGIMYSVIGLIIGVIIGLVGGVILGIFTHGYERLEERANNYHDKVVVPAETKCQQQQVYIDNLVNGPVMEMLFNTVPEEFRTLDALEFCLRMLKNGQADTEKECYNLYMEYSQKQQLISLQNQQISLAQKTLEQQKEQTKATEKLGEVAKEQNKIMETMEKRQRKISKQVRYGNVVSTINLVKKKSND